MKSAREGKLSDFKGFILDDKYKKQAHYYYVQVKVENVGEGDVGGVPVPLWGVNGDNTLLPAVNFTTDLPQVPVQAAAGEVRSRQVAEHLPGLPLARQGHPAVGVLPAQPGVQPDHLEGRDRQAHGDAEQEGQEEGLTGPVRRGSREHVRDVLVRDGTARQRPPSAGCGSAQAARPDTVARSLDGSRGGAATDGAATRVSAATRPVAAIAVTVRDVGRAVSFCMVVPSLRTDWDALHAAAARPVRHRGRPLRSRVRPLRTGPVNPATAAVPGPDSKAMHDVPGSSSSLVGRDEETRLLQTALTAASGGDPRAVFVLGEAGVGKTVLVRTAAGAPSRDGTTVLWAPCLRFAAAESTLLPLVLAFERWRRDAGPDAEAVLGSVPGAEALLPTLGGHGAAGPVSMLPVVAGLLDRLAQAAPTVLVVDDLQWADPATRDALAFVLAGFRHQRLAVLATIRSAELAAGDPLLGWLADVRRLPGVEQLRLGRLGARATAEQVSVLLGEDAHPALAAEVFRRSEGNPYLSELLVSGLDPASETLPDDLPDELVDVLLAAWHRLPAQARTGLQLLAVAGAAGDGDRAGGDRRLDGAGGGSGPHAGRRRAGAGRAGRARTTGLVPAPAARRDPDADDAAGADRALARGLGTGPGAGAGLRDGGAAPPRRPRPPPRGRRRPARRPGRLPGCRGPQPRAARPA